jgi:hypothetical protein
MLLWIITRVSASRCYLLYTLPHYVQFTLLIDHSYIWDRSARPPPACIPHRCPSCTALLG